MVLYRLCRLGGLDYKLVGGIRSPLESRKRRRGNAKARRNGQSLSDRIDQTSGLGFFCCEVVVLAIQPGHHIFGCLAGLTGIADGHCLSPFVQFIGTNPHLGCVADSNRHRRVNHHDSVFRHGVFGRQRDQAGDTRRHPVNVNCDIARMALDGVVDRQAVRNRPANRIDADDDLIIFQCIEIAHKVGGTYRLFPPAFADVAVDVDLCRRLDVGFGFDGVPGHRVSLQIAVFLHRREQIRVFCENLTGELRGIPSRGLRRTPGKPLSGWCR